MNFATLSNEIPIHRAFIWFADFLVKEKMRIFFLHGQKI